MSAAPRVRVGVASCLLGEAVRYDGAHKRCDALITALDEHVEWVPVCPEIEVGMGVPRPPVELVQLEGESRMRDVRSGLDHTDRVRRFSEARVEALRAGGLHGYVLKRGSPSCGARGVGRRSPQGGPGRTGPGLFAAALLEALPDLPLAQEDELSDAGRCKAFLERALAYRDRASREP